MTVTDVFSLPSSEWIFPSNFIICSFWLSSFLSFLSISFLELFSSVLRYFDAETSAIVDVAPMVPLAKSSLIHFIAFLAYQLAGKGLHCKSYTWIDIDITYICLEIHVFIHYFCIMWTYRVFMWYEEMAM